MVKHKQNTVYPKQMQKTGDCIIINVLEDDNLTHMRVGQDQGRDDQGGDT